MFRLIFRAHVFVFQMIVVMKDAMLIVYQFILTAWIWFFFYADTQPARNTQTIHGYAHLKQTNLDMPMKCTTQLAVFRHVDWDAKSKLHQPTQSWRRLVRCIAFCSIAGRRCAKRFACRETHRKLNHYLDHTATRIGRLAGVQRLSQPRARNRVNIICVKSW